MKQSGFRFWMSAALSIWLLAEPGAWAATDWYMLKNNGKSIGTVRIESYPSPDDVAGLGGTVTEVSNTGHFTREGSPFEMNAVSRFVEGAADGKPLSFSYEYALGNQRMMAAQGRVQGNQLDVRLDMRMTGAPTAASGQATVRDDQFLFPGGNAMQRLYRQHYDDAPGSRFHFQTVSLGVQPEIVNTEVTRLGSEKLALAAGGKKQLGKFAVRNPAHPQSGVYEWRDAQGKLYKAKSIGEDGMEMVYASQREVRNVGRASVDVVATSAVLSNRIAQPRVTTEALYRIAPIHGQQISASQFPIGSNQAIIDQQDGVITLKVWQHQPADATVEFPMQAQAHYLRSTPFVESSDFQIDRTALDIVGKEKRAYYAARLLQQWVYRNIAHKDLSLGFATARQTLLSRQGDCTEHAVLFAALARALGIPTRVAIGLVYIPNGDSQNLGRFVYHMWDEIYLGDRSQGEWVPFDATNPEPMPDATHIKIADSALENMGDLMVLTRQVVALMGTIKIDTLKALSSSQSTLTVGRQSGVLAVDVPKVDIEQMDIRTLSRQAIQHFRVTLPPASLAGNTTDGLFTAGVAALAQGQYDSAQTAFKKALTKLHRPIEAYRMGEQLAGIEMYALAQKAFQVASAEDAVLAPLVDSWMTAYLPVQNLPDELNRQFMAALYEQGDATALLKRVIAEAPSFAPAYRHLGERLSGPAGIELLKQAVALAPKDFRNAESLGDALMAQKQASEATQAYREACGALQGTPFAQSKSWLEDVHGKWELAYGSALLARNKRDASAWVSMAKGLLRQHRQDEAGQAIQNALALRPSDSEAQRLAFEMALQQGDWKGIYATQRHIAAMAGQNAQAAALLGQYQMRIRQYAAAVRSFQQAIAKNPQTIEPYSFLSQTYLRMAEQQDAQKAANTSNSQSRRTQAMAVLRQGMGAVSTTSDRHALALQLADLLLKSGNSAEAQTLTERVLTENPINGRAYVLKGQSQFYAGRYSQARDTLEAALVLNPNDPDALALLGHVAQEEGREAQALDYYQKAYKADPLKQDAAASYRALTDKLQIMGQSLPEYWALSDDEHDYLVQLLYQGKQIKLNTRNYLGKLAALPGSAGQVEISVQGVHAIQSFPPFLNRLYDTELAGYHRLQAMNVPPRFAQLHYLLLTTSRAHLDIFNNAVQRFPTLNTATPETAQAFQILLGGINGVDQAVSQVLELIAAKLPPPVYQGLLAEAQLNDLPILDQDIARFTSDLLSRKAPDAAASNAPATPKADDHANTATSSPPPVTDPPGNNLTAAPTQPPSGSKP